MDWYHWIAARCSAEIEGEERAPWKPGGVAHAAWQTLKAHLVPLTTTPAKYHWLQWLFVTLACVCLQKSHPEDWIGPWEKNKEGRWCPHWPGAMDSEYRSMREMMQTVLLEGQGPQANDTGGRPPWRIPGRASEGGPSCTPASLREDTCAEHTGRAPPGSLQSSLHCIGESWNGGDVLHCSWE